MTTNSRRDVLKMLAGSGALVTGIGTVTAQETAKLSAVRNATEKYHDVEVAETDGYAPTPECVEDSAGGMGIHYINQRLIGDGKSVPTKPEVLLYEQGSDGLELVGVEYFVVAAEAKKDPPVVLGEEMMGPMPGHGPDEPEHYDLHAWVWKDNPNGVFAPFNPNVTCSE